MYPDIMHRSIIFASLLLPLILALGCGGTGGGPVAPGSNQGLTDAQATPGGNTRSLWGFWQVEMDPVTLEATITPLRGAQFTCNVTRFLQPPDSPLNLLGISIDPGASDIPADLLAVDVTIKHPFPGLPKFRGFDVRGVFMSDPSLVAGFDPTAQYPNWFAASPGIAGEEPVLLNADGYTRWWNPTEFTSYGKIFGYTQGGLAPGAYLASATLNAFKYFADELETEGDFELNPYNRGEFSVQDGVNTRRYLIQFAGTPWLFNYAIDASWNGPDPSGAPDYPVSSFPPDANSAEAYRISLIDAGSTAYYVDSTLNGGEFLLDVEIFDWQANTSVQPSAILNEISAAWLESPAFDDGAGNNYLDILSGVYEIHPGSGNTSAVLRVTIDANFETGGIDHAGGYPVLIAVESPDPNTYEPQISGGNVFDYPNAPLAAYAVAIAEVSGVSPQEAPNVISVVPDEGLIDTLLQDVEVHGEFFMNGAIVSFSHESEPFSIGPLASNYIDDTLLQIDLDLSGALTGYYDVTVENPDMQSGEKEAAFSVLDTIPVLVLEEEIAFEATNPGYDMYTPAICVEHDGDVVVAYEEWLLTPSTPDDYNTSYSSAYKSTDDGLTWPEWAWSFASFGLHHHGDCAKIWPSSHNTSYRTLNLIMPDELEWSTGFFATTFPGPNGGEYAHVSHYIFHANEILQDPDKYVYVLGDKDGYIHFKRSEVPEHLTGGPNGPVWSSLPTYTLVNPGTLSRARSSALYNDVMYLAYFEEGNNIIKLAYDTGDWQVWDTSTNIWDGTDTGTTGARDPGLQIDDTGFHVTFIRHDDAADLDQLCYTYSDDGASWSEPVVVHESAETILDSPIIRYDWDDLSTLGTVWWEGDTIWAKFSIDDGATWSDPVLVSETYAVNKQSDLAIALTENWHFVFASLNPTTGLWEIHYRRGHMEWQ